MGLEVRQSTETGHRPLLLLWFRLCEGVPGATQGPCRASLASVLLEYLQACVEIL